MSPDRRRDFRGNRVTGPARSSIRLTKATTLQGQDVTITVSGTTVKVNDATVTATDVLATNGVIHVIDTVLWPK